MYTGHEFESVARNAFWMMTFVFLETCSALKYAIGLRPNLFSSIGQTPDFTISSVATWAVLRYRRLGRDQAFVKLEVQG